MDKLNHERPTWLVFANTIEAEIYQIDKNDYTLIKTLVHPQSRLKSEELGSDGPGHYKTDHSSSGKFIPPSDPHKEEHAHFAKQLADFLEEQRLKNQYQSLIICAEPHFHGLINQTISKSVCSLITKSIAKDYIPVSKSPLSKSKMSMMIESIINDKF